MNAYTAIRQWHNYLYTQKNKEQRPDSLIMYSSKDQSTKPESAMTNYS